MNEIRWVRGVPTREERLTCVLASGGTGDNPRFVSVHAPDETSANNWDKNEWYAAVRILPPESQNPADDPEEWVEITNHKHVLRDDDEATSCDNIGITSYWLQSDMVGFVRCGKMRIVGQTVGDWSDTLRFRCRRKDLPPLPTVEESDRWFIWAGHRYPIAFVKHADGTCQNLNVDFEYKNSDSWGERWEAQLQSGELKEVTEAEAVEHLKKPWKAKPDVQQVEGPQPGQFYENEIGKRRQVIGVTSKGMFAVEFDFGDVITYSNEYIAANWKHLPWCKSFTDVEPKKTKMQRKWVTKQWITDGESPNPDIADGYLWESTDDVREVPL